MNKKLHANVTSLFIGRPFDEMADTNVLDELDCIVVYSSSAMNRALVEKPKLIVFKTFENQEENSSILQEVLSKCSDAKIIVLGKTKEDFTRVISSQIDMFLPSDISFESFKIYMDQLLFEQSYGEKYNENILLIDNDNPLVSNVVFFSLISIVFVLLIFSYFLLS